MHLNCWKELEEHGILGESPVDHVFSKFIDKGLCKQDILGMMEQHGLIAKFSVDTGENRDEQRYFVPTQLGSSQSKLDEIKLCECDPCPLVLHFLDGFVPHGLFPQLVSKFIHWCSKNGLKKNSTAFQEWGQPFHRKIDHIYSYPDLQEEVHQNRFKEKKSVPDDECLKQNGY